MKKRFLAQKFWDLPPTVFAQCAVKGREHGDLINLTIGDPDIDTDNRITEAAFIDAKNGYTHYTAYPGDPELIAEIHKYYQEEYGYEIGANECQVVVGGSEGLYLTLAAIIDPGDEVIYHEPAYPPYLVNIELAGGKPVVLPTYAADNFQIDTKKLEALITNKTKALLLNTPGNPTGSCFSRKTLEEIAVIAKKHDLLVIADDIYTLFSYAEPFIPLMTLEGMRERTITINSYSKDFAMTGWRVGCVIAPDYIIDSIRYVKLGNTFCTASVSQRAALHAIRMRKEIQPKLLAEFKERTYYAYERINKIHNMSVPHPAGSIYQFIDISKTGLTSLEVYQRILDEAHVLVLPGVAFGECGDGHLRIALTVGVDKLKEAFDRIEKMDIFNKK